MNDINLQIEVPIWYFLQSLFWFISSGNYMPMHDIKYAWILSYKQQCRQIFYPLSGLPVEVNTLQMNSRRRKQQPIPVFLRRESCGQRSLVGCCPQGCIELDTTEATQHACMHWRRKWQPTPVFLPGESQGRGSLVGCRLWGRTESDTTEAIQQQQRGIPFSILGKKKAENNFQLLKQLFILEIQIKVSKEKYILIVLQLCVLILVKAKEVLHYFSKQMNHSFLILNTMVQKLKKLTQFALKC